MLDRKIKDRDASIELLEDRAKTLKLFFLVFFIIGWSVTWIGVLFVPYKYDEIAIGAGIAVLIFATWFYISLCYYTLLIAINKDKEK